MHSGQLLRCQIFVNFVSLVIIILNLLNLLKLFASCIMKHCRMNTNNDYLYVGGLSSRNVSAASNKDNSTTQGHRASTSALPEFALSPSAAPPLGAPHHRKSEGLSMSSLMVSEHHSSSMRTVSPLTPTLSMIHEA
jgi:hypothetical protein